MKFQKYVLQFSNKQTSGSTAKPNYQPDIKSPDELTNKSETVRETPAVREDTKTPSITQVSLASRNDDTFSKSIQEASMPELDFIVQEITYDGSSDSADWIDIESDDDASDAFFTARLKISTEELNPEADDKIPSHGEPLPAFPEIHSVASKESTHRKALATDTVVPGALKSFEMSANTVVAMSPESAKVSVNKGKGTSGSELTQDSVAPGVASTTTPATSAPSQTTEPEPKKYNIFPNSQLREDIEEAMRATFPTEIVDAMLADLNGDAVLSTGTTDADTIQRLLEGIDASHRKCGLASLAKLYPKRLSKPDAATEAVPKTMTPKERLAAMNVNEARLKMRKEERAKRDLAKKQAAKMEITKIDVEAVKVDVESVEVDLKDIRPADKVVTPVKQWIVAKSPVGKGRSRHLDLSSKQLTPVREDNKENEDPNMLPWWEKDSM